MTTERTSPMAMLIPVQNDTASSSSRLPEWAMIELNGELIAPTVPSDKENPSATPSDESFLPKDQVELGSVRFSENGKPVMILGTHELQGKVESLKQPFCVLQKERTTEGTSYRISGIVTQKLLFNKYPKVILR